MDTGQMIALTLWAGIAGIQHRLLGVIQIERPLVSGLIVGLVLGDLPTGLTVGASFELIFIGTHRLGGSVPPNILIGTILGAATAIVTGQGVEAALAIGVPAALIGSLFEVFSQTVCSFFMHSAEAYAGRIPPHTVGIARMAHLGNSLYFLTAAIPVYVGLQFGPDAARAFFAVIPAGILSGLRLLGKILPAVGFATLLSMLLSRRFLPFLLLGFALAAFLKFNTVGIALVGLAAAMIAFEFVREPGIVASGAIEAAMPEPAAALLDRGDLRRLFWRSFGLQSAFNFERFQALGLLWVLLPILRKLHTNPEDLRQALQRHLTFFKTEPILGGSGIIGITAFLEERRACGEPIDDAAINAVKVGLMGPLAGIGDSLIQVSLRVIAAGIGISLAQQGSALGPILFLVLFNVPNFLIRWYGITSGYALGGRVLEALRGLQLKRWLESGTILGLTVIGGLIPALVRVTTPITYTVDGQAAELQQILDGMLPGLIPLVLTFFSFWLLRRGWNSLYVMLLLIGVGLVAGYLEILS